MSISHYTDLLSLMVNVRSSQAMEEDAASTVLAKDEEPELSCAHYQDGKGPLRRSQTVLTVCASHCNQSLLTSHSENDNKMPNPTDPRVRVSMGVLNCVGPALLHNDSAHIGAYLQKKPGETIEVLPTQLSTHRSRAVTLAGEVP